MSDAAAGVLISSLSSCCCSMCLCIVPYVIFLIGLRSTPSRARDIVRIYWSYLGIFFPNTWISTPAPTVQPIACPHSNSKSKKSICSS